MKKTLTMILGALALLLASNAYSAEGEPAPDFTLKTLDGTNLLDKIPVTFPVLFDPQNSTSETYGVDAMPTTVLIDRNGVVRHHHRGYKDGYMDKYEEQVKALVLE